MGPASLPDTAAYSASQPLFDTLRIAAARIDEQRELLNIAKEQVQKLHVKLHHEQSSGGAAQHDRYVDCIVRAWKSVTESYADVFRELAAMTAADATEGRAEKPNHEQFQGLKGTAVTARLAAENFIKRVLPNEREADASNPDERTNRATPSSILGKRTVGVSEDVAPKHLRKRPRTGTGKDEPVTMPATATPYNATLASKKHFTTTHRVRDREEDAECTPQGVHLASGTQAHGEALLGDGVAPAQPTQALQSQDLKVLYEDVSREVEARLKAKRERRKEKRGENKRKRQSADSHASNEAPEHVTEQLAQFSGPRRDKDASKMPPKKRPKQETRSETKSDNGLDNRSNQAIPKRKTDDGSQESNRRKRTKMRPR